MINPNKLINQEFFIVIQKYKDIRKYNRKKLKFSCITCTVLVYSKISYPGPIKGVRRFTPSCTFHTPRGCNFKMTLFYQCNKFDTKSQILILIDIVLKIIYPYHQLKKREIGILTNYFSLFSSFNVSLFCTQIYRCTRLKQ